MQGGCGLGSRAWLLAAALMITLCHARAAHAQRGIDVQRFVPALDPSGFLAVQGTQTPGSMQSSFGLFLDYQKAPLETAGASALESVQHRIGGSVSAELGLGSRFAVAVLMPVVLFQAGDESSDLGPDDDFELKPIAAGDPLLAARYRLLGEASADPLLPKDGPGVALELRARLPVGPHRQWAGEGTTRLGARLLFDLQLLGAGLGGMLGWEHRVHERYVAGEKLTGELQAGAAAKVPLPSLHPLSAVAELRFASDFRSYEGTALEGDLGLRATLGEWTLSLAGGGGLSGRVGVPDLRILVGVWYAPQPTDADRDGVDDDEDKCGQLAEDPDGFEDHDGCPDPDNDNDLVPDIDDLCPNVEALEGQDNDEDGCTDAAP
jgi:hypothetical protein